MSSRIPMVSPLAHVSGKATTKVEFTGVALEELPSLCHCIIRLQPDDKKTKTKFRRSFGSDVPTDPNTFLISNDILVAWLGPDEWIVLSQLFNSNDVMEKLIEVVADQFATWVDVTNAQTVIRVTGPKAVELLNRGISYDLHPSVFLAGSCIQTVMARIPVTVLKQESDVQCIDLIVKRSFADYLWSWLIDAGQEAEFQH